MALCFSATRESYNSLAIQFRIIANIICCMIPYTCKMLYQVLSVEYLHCPNTQEEWLAISQPFEGRWQFPNCLGAGDGKHMHIWCPAYSGSEYFYYKGLFSLILLASVRPDYRAMNNYVGCHRSAGNGGVIGKSSLWEACTEGPLNLPPPQSLPQSPDLLFEGTSDHEIGYFFTYDHASNEAILQKTLN